MPLIYIGESHVSIIASYNLERRTPGGKDAGYLSLENTGQELIIFVALMSRLYVEAVPVCN